MINCALNMHEIRTIVGDYSASNFNLLLSFRACLRIEKQIKGPH